jgi:hypothetical protein
MTVPVINPLVRAAVTALDTFGALNRGDAAELLTMWARRPQLLDAEVRAVLDHYPPPADPDNVGYYRSPMGDPTGLGYSREQDTPTGENPVPEHVQGHPVTGRRAER